MIEEVEKRLTRRGKMTQYLFIKTQRKKIEELKKDHTSKMTELDEDLADKLEDITADETKKISRMEEDFNIRREKAKKDSAKRKEKIRLSRSGVYWD